MTQKFVMKTLTIIPMIHTLQEFGSVRESVRAAQETVRGAEGANKFFEDIEQYWQEVRRRIKETYRSSPDSAKGLCIFIDGLPNVDERIVEIIVRDMVAQQIPAYHIIQELQKAGAKVYGTEDPKFLLEEHAVWTQAARGEKADAQKLQMLMEKRDVAIAKRIDEVLTEEGRGLLFIGKAHNVVKELEKLPSKFRVMYL